MYLSMSHGTVASTSVMEGNVHSMSHLFFCKNHRKWGELFFQFKWHCLKAESPISTDCNTVPVFLYHRNSVSHYMYIELCTSRRVDAAPLIIES